MAATRAGSTLPDEFELILARVRAWAGPRRLAIVLSGSFASGEAVAVEIPGAGRRFLSDVDLYVVLPDADTQRAARARQWREADWRPAGFAAAVEVAFVTPADLAALPARPATLHLKRHGQVLEGDPHVLGHVPDWRPRDIDVEERLLLLENRAFELLAARGMGAGPLERARRAHAVHKTVRDLALEDALATGAWPADEQERFAVVLARAADPAGDAPDFEAAFAWRSGHAGAARIAAADPAAAGRALLRRWCALVAPGRAAPDALALVERAAARSPLARRWRRSIQDHARRPGLESLWSRVRHAPRGTPQHRLNASAIALLTHRCARTSDAARVTHTLARLGVAEAADPDRAEAALIGRWSLAVLGRERP